MIISGETLRRLRVMHGIKQEVMAQKLSISQPAYSKLEKSEQIKNEKLKEIFKILGYSEEELEDMIKHLPPKTN